MSVEVLQGRKAFKLTVAALAWALIPLAVALLWPIETYNSADGPAHAEIAMLFERNGPGILVALAIPALVVSMVWFLLHRKCSYGSHFSGTFALVLIAVLGIISLFTTMYLVGLLLMPAVALLAGAARLTPTGVR